MGNACCAAMPETAAFCFVAHERKRDQGRRKQERRKHRRPLKNI